MEDKSPQPSTRLTAQQNHHHPNLCNNRDCHHLNHNHVSHHHHHSNLQSSFLHQSPDHTPQYQPYDLNCSVPDDLCPLPKEPEKENSVINSMDQQHQQQHQQLQQQQQSSTTWTNGTTTLSLVNQGLQQHQHQQQHQPQQPQPQQQQQQPQQLQLQQQQPQQHHNPHRDNVAIRSVNLNGVATNNNLNGSEPLPKKLHTNGKKTKGRVKIKMEFIDNKLRRYTTFSKRKSGIMKKAYELSTLTGTQVMLLVASETGHVYTFATKKLKPMITSDTGKALIKTCLFSPEPQTNGYDPRMSSTGYEETELSYSVNDDSSEKFSVGFEN